MPGNCPCRRHVRGTARLLWGWRAFVDQAVEERLVMSRLLRRSVFDAAGG